MANGLPMQAPESKYIGGLSKDLELINFTDPTLMKKALAILLIAVHLLNLVGCYGLFAKLEVIYQNRFSLRLDNDEYAGSDAITLRLPLTSTYPSKNTDYQRVEGKFLYEGEVYQLVKQKTYNNTIYLICVKDNKSTELRDKLQDYTAALADHSSKAPSRDKTANISVEEFDSVELLCLSKSTFLINPIQLPEYSFSEKLNVDFKVDQPPKV